MGATPYRGAPSRAAGPAPFRYARDTVQKYGGAGEIQCVCVCVCVGGGGRTQSDAIE